MPEAFADFLTRIRDKNIRNFAQLLLDESEWGPGNDKSDSNKADVGINVNYAEADAATRHSIYEHTRDLWLSFWYMLANDPSLSNEFKWSVRVWGPARDEFVEKGNVTPTLYVRKARRMIGRYIMTQKDVQTDRIKPDVSPSAATSSTLIPCRRSAMPAGLISEGSNIAGSTDPTKIPYCAITPLKPDNLLITFDLSATQIGYYTIRMELVFMTIGRAAALSIQDHLSVQNVSVGKLRAESKTRKSLLSLCSARASPFSSMAMKRRNTHPLSCAAALIPTSFNKFYWNFDRSGAVNSKEISATWTSPTAKPTVVSLMVEDAEGHTSVVAKRKLPSVAITVLTSPCSLSRPMNKDSGTKPPSAGLDECDLVRPVRREGLPRRRPPSSRSLPHQCAPRDQRTRR